MSAGQNIYTTALLHEQSGEYVPAISVGSEILCVFPNDKYEDQDEAVETANDMLEALYHFLLDLGADFTPTVGNDIPEAQGSA